MLASLVASCLNESSVDEYYFDIKPGQPLPPETRIAMPDMSFEQELLSVPVPFRNRVAMVSPADKVDAKKLAGAEIAEQLGVPVAKVHRLATELNAPVAETLDGDVRYEAYVNEVLKEDLEWQAIFDQLPEELSAFRIAKLLAVTQKWVAYTAHDLAVFPEQKMHGGRRALFYPKSLVQMLRTVRLHAPPAHDEYTITELEAMLQKDHRWIESVLAKRGIERVVRTNLRTNEISDHYPAEAVDFLLEAKEALPPPAGGWLTMSEISKALNKSRNWTGARLEAFESLAELRLTNHSKPFLHYPPYVLEYLVGQLSEKDQESQWYSEAEIALHAQRSIFWVRTRAREYHELSEQFPTGPNNRMTRHYPEFVMEKIVALADAEPPQATSELTVQNIAEMLERPRKWVIDRIARLGIQSTLLLDSKMKARDHYDPETMDALQLHFMIDEENAQAPQNSSS